jgi:uncharacterized protein YabN with tetrapyrrole methylase and pyrophosphatase domain
MLSHFDKTTITLDILDTMQMVIIESMYTAMVDAALKLLLYK